MGKFDLPSLRVRIASALILAPLVIVVIAYGGWPFILFILACALISLTEWFHLARNIKEKQHLYYLLGPAYIIFCFGCCYLIREMYSAAAALLFIAMIWSSDIGAYFAGKIIGGPKLAPQISPKKTWAGLGGAMLAPAIVGVASIWVMPYAAAPAFMPWVYCGMVAAAGLAVGLAGQGGDLLVSFAKRKAGVKDAGHLIPGHGGLLDRVDGLMLASVPYLIFAGVVTKAFL